TQYIIPRQVMRRRIEQAAAFDQGGGLCQPGGIPEGTNLPLRLVARASAAVEALPRGRIDEERFAVFHAGWRWKPANADFVAGVRISRWIEATISPPCVACKTAASQCLASRAPAAGRALTSPSPSFLLYSSSAIA